MIEKNVCLLLGAGASAHLGFPLGEELKHSIVEELGNMVNRDLSHHPEGIRDSGEDLEEFYERLKMGDWNSPDAFLEEYPQFMNTGKYLICLLLALKEQKSDFNRSTGWYKHLINAIRVDDLDDLKHNNLSIVTFNYDRSIDHRLHGYVKAKSESRDREEAWHIVEEAFDIIHLHGTIGEYRAYEYGTTDEIHERSKDIKIISEVEAEQREDGFVNETFKKASELLNNADRVVALGFGFAKDNVDRLRYFEEKYTSKSEQQDVWNMRKVGRKSPTRHESREVIIAAGNIPNVYRRSMEEWLFQWGLSDNVYFDDANTFFEQTRNPFIFEQ